MLAIKKYSAPRTLETAARILAAGRATPLAGGTDLLLRWSRGLVDAGPTIVDLKQIASLRGVSRAKGEIRVRACALLSEIASDPTVRTVAPVLVEAADRVACPQIRNRATIGGNLCNASPAADTAVPLILLDAVVDLVSAGPGRLTQREVAITDFFHGPGATVVAPGEVLKQVRFKPLPDAVFTAWDKFGTRRAMEIAVASVGVAIQVEDGRVVHARVGYGSVAPIPLRGRKAEAELVDHPLSPDVIEKCAAAARSEVTPITDVRASAAYRRELVGVMLRRMLERAAHERQS